MNVITATVARVTKSLQSDVIFFFFSPSKLKDVPPTFHTMPYGKYFLKVEPQRELATLKESRGLNAQLWCLP